MPVMNKTMRFFTLAVMSLCIISCNQDEDTESDKPIISGSADGYGYVDMGLSVQWASCNVGADKPYDAGDYFAWGETVTKDIFSLETYTYNGPEKLSAENDVATQTMGDGWRMPTVKEIQELMTKCEWQYTHYPKTDTYGFKVINKSNRKNYIFIPFAGYKENGEWTNRSSAGRYLSSESTKLTPRVLSIDESGETLINAHPFLGFTVRAVHE